MKYLVKKGCDFSIEKSGEKLVYLDFMATEEIEALKGIDPSKFGNWWEFTPNQEEKIASIVSNIRTGNLTSLNVSFESWGEDLHLYYEKQGNYGTIIYENIDNEFYSIYTALEVYTQDILKDNIDFMEEPPMVLCGQSPVPAMLATKDLNLLSDVVDYFLRNSQLHPDQNWFF